jgi:O-antigen ligase
VTARGSDLEGPRGPEVAAHVGEVVAVGAFAALAGRRAFAHWKHVPLMLLGGVALIALIADACLGFRFAHKVTHDWRGSGRFALCATALSMFQSAPLLGHGPRSFVWLGADAGTIPWTHNLYLELLAEQGALGLLCFLALIGVGLVMLPRVVRSRRDDVRSFGAGAAFIAFLTAALFELEPRAPTSRR